MTLGYYHQADFALNSTPSSTCQRGMSRFDCKSFLAEGQSTDYCLGRGNAKRKGLKLCLESVQSAYFQTSLAFSNLSVM